MLKGAHSLLHLYQSTNVAINQQEFYTLIIPASNFHIIFLHLHSIAHIAEPTHAAAHSILIPLRFNLKYPKYHIKFTQVVVGFKDQRKVNGKISLKIIEKNKSKGHQQRYRNRKISLNNARFNLSYPLLISNMLKIKRFIRNYMQTLRKENRNDCNPKNISFKRLKRNMKVKIINRLIINGKF